VIPLKQVFATMAVVVSVPLLMGGCHGIVDPGAHDLWKQNLGDTSITIFPTFVRTASEPQYSAVEAARIGEFFTNDGLAQVVLGDAEVPITGEWKMNQAAMLRESAADFTRYVVDHPAETEYTALAECLMGGHGRVVGIHGYVLDAQGRVADAVLLNSHHRAFANANPSSVEDCTSVLISVLRDELRSE
jgi:hypothetical protein